MPRLPTRALASFEPFFAVDDDAPALFALRHRPAGVTRARVLVLPPFAEEMNKCRRMTALGARALASAGAEVLMFDPRGCGDSAGDFADATWGAWLDDAERMLGCFEAGASTPLWLWGLRAGALLATELAARRVDAASNLLLWVPVAAGKPHLQQFLRLKLAADLTADGDTGRAPGAMAALRRKLDDAGAIDVAGYRLGAELARSLDAARLVPPPAARPVRVISIEVTNRPGDEPSPSPAATAFAEACRSAGHEAAAQAVRGPAFWQTVEIEEAPALVEAGVAALFDAQALIAATDVTPDASAWTCA